MELKKLRGVILAGLALIGLALSIFLAKNLIDNKASAVAPARKIIKEVVVQKALNGPVTISVPAQGLVTAKKRIEIYSEVQGVFRMGAQLFRTGQSYQSNEILIQIDAAEYLANVKSSRTNLYNQIAAILPDIRLDFSKEYPTWLAFLNAINVDKNLPDMPEMSDENLKLFVSGRGVLGAYYSVKNLEQRLSKYQVRAPFNGVLTEALVTEGTLVRSGQKLGEFIQPGLYELMVSIPKSYALKLNQGATVSLSNMEGTQSFTGKVVRLNAKVDPSTQTTSVAIEINDPNLYEGVYLKATLAGNTLQNAISLPRALISEGNTIFALENNTLKAIQVTPLHYSEGQVVVAGIPEGLEILAKPLLGAYEGMTVNPDRKSVV